VVQEGGEHRADEEASVPRDTEERIRRSERRRLHDEWDDAAERGVEEAVSEPDERREQQDEREGQVAGRVGQRETADRAEAREVGDDHQRPPAVAVGEDSADQQRREGRHRLRNEDETELRRAGQRERPPPERGDEGGVADQGDGLARPQEAEVPVLERVEDTRAPARSEQRCHRASLFFQGCRSGFALPAFS